MTTKIQSIKIKLGNPEIEIELTLAEAQELQVALNDLFKVEKEIQPVYVPLPYEWPRWPYRTPIYSSDKIQLCYTASNTRTDKP